MERIDGRASGIGESFDVQIRCSHGRRTAEGTLSEEIVKETVPHAEVTPNACASIGSS
jgi:hypothetical protein